MATPNFAPLNSGGGGPQAVVQPWTGSSGGGGVATGGSNQWMSYPSMPGSGGGVPNLSGTYNPTATPLAGQTPGTYGEGMPGGNQNLGSNTFTSPTMDPQFTNQFYQYLTQMLGQSAGTQNNLLSFLSGGQSSIPGSSTLANTANTGNPIDQTPAWQAMVAAQQQNTQLGETALKEQMGSMGMLSSSSSADAMSQYLQQTTLGQNAQLTAAQSQSLENAANRSLSADTSLQSETANMDQFMQSLLSGGALSSPQTYQKQPGQSIGQLLGGAGSILGGVGALGTAANNAGGLGALFAGMI